MPLVKLKHILSFTSEDPVSSFLAYFTISMLYIPITIDHSIVLQIHKAENLLKDDSSHKWKCSAGEKQASVIFQLEKSSCINSIDIGNDGSAFIEILVGRNADVVQYQVRSSLLYIWTLIHIIIYVGVSIYNNKIVVCLKIQISLSSSLEY